MKHQTQNPNSDNQMNRPKKDQVTLDELKKIIDSNSFFVFEKDKEVLEELAKDSQYLKSILNISS